MRATKNCLALRVGILFLIGANLLQADPHYTLASNRPKGDIVESGVSGARIGLWTNTSQECARGGIALGEAGNSHVTCSSANNVRHYSEIGVSPGVFTAASQAVAQEDEADVDWEAYSEDITIYDINSEGVRLPGDQQVDEFAKVSDGDGIVDVRDSDDDKVADNLDACPMTMAGEVVDAAGCSVNNRCPCDNNWKNQSAYVRCVADTSGTFVAAGFMTEVEQGTIVSIAGMSSCGDK